MIFSGLLFSTMVSQPDGVGCPSTASVYDFRRAIEIVGERSKLLAKCFTKQEFSCFERSDFTEEEYTVLEKVYNSLGTLDVHSYREYDNLAESIINNIKLVNLDVPVSHFQPKCPVTHVMKRSLTKDKKAQGPDILPVSISAVPRTATASDQMTRSVSEFFIGINHKLYISMAFLLLSLFAMYGGSLEFSKGNVNVEKVRVEQSAICNYVARCPSDANIRTEAFVDVCNQVILASIVLVDPATGEPLDQRVASQCDVINLGTGSEDDCRRLKVENKIHAAKLRRNPWSAMVVVGVLAVVISASFALCA